MARYITDDELKKAHTDEKVRARMKAGLEELIGIGKLKVHSIDSSEFGTRMNQRVATEDAIIRFCYDLGFHNPLYCNPGYAISIGYDGLIAPPHFLTAISRFAGSMYTELNDYDYITEAFECGLSGEWFGIPREDDLFSVVEIPTKVIDVTRKDTSIRFLVSSKKIYKNQRDETISIIYPSMMVTFPRSFGEWDGFKKRPPKARYFAPTEIAEWRKLVDQEPIRGATPRYWEDVKLGDQIPPVHHMYVPTEYCSFIRGGGYEVGFCWRIQMEKSRKRINGWQAVVDSESGLPSFSSPHLNNAAATKYGLPKSLAPGAQMTCWACNALINWMGDMGFLKKIENQYRRPLWKDSLVICKGKVIKKYIEGNEHLVEVSFTVEDHNGDMPIPNGTATIALPSRQLPDPFKEMFFGSSKNVN